MSDAVLVPVLPAHRFDVERLDTYLRHRIAGFDGISAVHQFQGGQSNPTYMLQTPGQAYVLRKKPPGVLLASAHAVEREYAAMHALAHTAVPVPTGVPRPARPKSFQAGSAATPERNSPRGSAQRSSTALDT